MTRWTDLKPDIQAQRVAKKRLIIAVATRAFVRDGYRQTSLVMIAKELGISKAALYRYVSSKEDLLLASQKEICNLAISSLTYGNRHGRTGLEKLQLGLVAYLSEMLELFGTAVLDVDMRDLSPECAAEIAHMNDRVRQDLRMLLELGMADGSVITVNTLIAMAQVMGSYETICKQYQGLSGWHAQDVAEAAVELATRGLDAWPKASLLSTLSIDPTRSKDVAKDVASA